MQSFSKKDYHFDNAFRVRFFKYLEKKNIYHSIQELQLSVFNYIKGYNYLKKLHDLLEMLSPNKKEVLFWKNS